MYIQTEAQVQPTFPVVPSPLLPPPSKPRVDGLFESGTKTLSIQRSYLLSSLSSFYILHSPFQRLFVQGRQFYFTQQLRLVDLPILIPPLIYPVLLLSNSLSPFFPDLFDSLSSSFNAEQWRSIFIPSR